MTILSNEIRQKRKEFRQQIFDEIKAESNSDRFYNNMFYVFAKLGLQKIAKQEGMLNSYEHKDLRTREAQLEKIRKFITKYIK